jgi:hypothetical protein
MARPTSPLDRVLLHLKASRLVVIEPHDVYYMEASGDETIVRRGSDPPVSQTVSPLDPLSLVNRQLPGAIGSGVRQTIGLCRRFVVH